MALPFYSATQKRTLLGKMKWKQARALPHTIIVCAWKQRRAVTAPGGEQRC